MEASCTLEVEPHTCASALPGIDFPVPAGADRDASGKDPLLACWLLGEAFNMRAEVRWWACIASCTSRECPNATRASALATSDLQRKKNGGSAKESPKCSQIPIASCTGQTCLTSGLASYTTSSRPQMMARSTTRRSCSESTALGVSPGSDAGCSDSVACRIQKAIYARPWFQKHVRGLSYVFNRGQ